MGLCYLFSAKTEWQLMNRKADFLQNESIRIDSHDKSNRFDSNRELECSNGDADRLNGDHAANVRYLWRQTY